MCFEVIIIYHVPPTQWIQVPHQARRRQLEVLVLPMLTTIFPISTVTGFIRMPRLPIVPVPATVTQRMSFISEWIHPDLRSSADLVYYQPTKHSWKLMMKGFKPSEYFFGIFSKEMITACFFDDNTRKHSICFMHFSFRFPRNYH